MCCCSWAARGCSLPLGSGATRIPNPWHLVAEEDDHIRVWRREVPGARVYEVKAETIVNQPVGRVWQVVTDVERFAEYMPYIAEIRVLGPAGKNAQYVYFRVDPPIVDQRDFTMKSVLEPNPDKGIWVRWWTLANDKGPLPREDVVRIPINDGRWRLEKLGSRSTLVTYWVFTDPGGSIPAWIANRANDTSVPDLLRSVRARAHNPAWKRAD
ncbi:START domain-containing protein [Myxococcota bacterium]